MQELKNQQPSMSIDEQIINLKQKGLIIEDEDYAKTILNDVSYYRLIKAYSLNLKEKNGNYDKNIHFEDIVELYLLNTSLRYAILPQIEKVEVNLRCRLSNYFCDKYGVLGYENINNFCIQEGLFQTFTDDMQKEVFRNVRSPLVMNFRNNYKDGKIPFYALVELFSFGTLSKFYKNMKNEDKKAIAATFGVGYTYLGSWIESLAFVRNVCAHYGRIYNIKFTKTPRMYNQYTEKGIKNNRLFATMIMLKHLLPNDRLWIDFVNTVELLFEKYASVNIHFMDFPKNWKDYLIDIDNLICEESRKFLL